MDRRHFLRFLTIGSAVGVAPSLLWPFRKIFLPLWPAKSSIILPDLDDWFPGCVDRSAFTVAAVEAIELEAFAKGIPDLLLNGQTLYNYFKADEDAAKRLGLSRTVYPGKLHYNIKRGSGSSWEKIRVVA